MIEVGPVLSVTMLYLIFDDLNKQCLVLDSFVLCYYEILQRILILHLIKFNHQTLLQFL